MGQEIPHSFFTPGDFEQFQKKLLGESRLLEQWFADDIFEDVHPVAGCELEAWLIDPHGDPVACNTECLKSFTEEQASPELSQFNIELNLNPVVLKENALSQVYETLKQRWSELSAVANRHGAECVYTGILPTVDNSHLTLENMSPLNRYYALNEQVLRQRKGKPLHLDIVGNSHLQLDHSDVMLESVTTSFQIHMQVPASKAARYINASMMLSAPLVALSANSPYLFGHDLWSETRIPVFEQAVGTGGIGDADRGPLKRVSFGSQYVRESLWECFAENLEHYPVLLPHDFNQPSEKMSHLQLHNGTIWRWNRPLIGISKSGKPHLRIEQRVVPAGPTFTDMIANMAFYYGLVESLACEERRPELSLEFAQSRDNFYKAARHGLSTNIQWIDGKSHEVKRLILDQLLEKAWQGLEKLQIRHEDIQHWLGIIEKRVISGQTGAVWQREFVAQHGDDMHQLLKAYQQRQQTDQAVHEWDI